jgi:hypothetical protein
LALLLAALGRGALRTAPHAPVQTALVRLCNGFLVHAGSHGSGMGIDAFGHTRLSQSREIVSSQGFEHTQRLLAILRRELVEYRSYRTAIAHGYLLEGDDVPVGALKHFFNYGNFVKNQGHLDPTAPSAILYRRTASGYTLAGVMFTAPIDVSMDELDNRIPLAFAHWHSHRNICMPHGSLLRLSAQDRSRFGFSGSIATRAACDRASGAFIDNVYGWMAHVYPFEADITQQF